MRLQREAQGVPAFGRFAFPCPVAKGDNEFAVLLSCSGANRAAVGFVEARPVNIWVTGVGHIASGDTAAFNVWRLAVCVAVLLINVLTQFPPLPLFQHLRLHLREEVMGETGEIVVMKIEKDTEDINRWMFLAKNCI